MQRAESWPNKTQRSSEEPGLPRALLFRIDKRDLRQTCFILQKQEWGTRQAGYLQMPNVENATMARVMLGATAADLVRSGPLKR